MMEIVVPLDVPEDDWTAGRSHIEVAAIDAIWDLFVKNFYPAGFDKVIRQERERDEERTGTGD